MSSIDFFNENIIETPDNGRTVVFVDPVTKKLASRNDQGVKTDYGSGGSGGTSDHSELSNLEYANSGHTGFEPAKGVDDNYVSTTEKNTWNAKQDALGFTPEDVVNKSTDPNLGTSSTLYPSQGAVKAYVDAAVVNAGGVVNIDDLQDVAITLPQNDDRLLYDSVSGKWINKKTPPTPQGSNGDVQFNDNGVTNGDSDFRFNVATSTVEIGQPVLALPNNPLSIAGNDNTYVQLNIQNKNSGALASTDIVVTADNGSDTDKFVNLGICGSTYSDPAQPRLMPNDSYLLADGGDLHIATTTAAKKIMFCSGVEAGATIGEIDSNGMNLASGKEYKINGTALPKASEVLPSTSFSGLSKITVGTTPPASPSIGDLFIDVS